MSTSAQTTDTPPQAPTAPPPVQRGISRSTLIEERRAGVERGQRKLLAELGYDSVEELRAVVEQHRGKRAAGGQAPQALGLDAVDIEDIVKRAVAERLAPLEQETAAQKQAREKQQQAEERAANEQRAAAEQAAREQAEAAEAQKQLEAELRFVRKVAKGVGAKLDKSSFEKLTKRVTVELNALDDEEFEEKFGADLDEEERAANLKALLGDIRKARPALFEEDKPASGGSEQQPNQAAVAPATTSRATAGATTAAPTSPATPRQLDTRKLSPKQFEEYKRDPAAFRTKFQNGLIDYPTK